MRRAAKHRTTQLVAWRAAGIGSLFRNLANPRTRRAAPVSVLAFVLMLAGSPASAELPQTPSTITQQDAIHCNAIFTYVGLARQGSSDSPDVVLLKDLPSNIGGQNRRLWQLIIELDPALRNDRDGTSKMYKLRDDYIAAHFDRYMQDIKALLAEYHKCVGKGIVPGEGWKYR